MRHRRVDRDHQIEQRNQRCGVGKIVQFRAVIDQQRVRRQPVALRWRKLLLQRVHLDPSSDSTGSSVSIGSERLGICCDPHQARPIRGGVRGPSRRCQTPSLAGGARRYGTSAGMLSSSVPNTNGRLSSGVTMSAGGSLSPPRSTVSTPSKRLHQRLQLDIGLQADVRTVASEQRRIAGELDHVAMPLLGTSAARACRRPPQAPVPAHPRAADHGRRRPSGLRIFASPRRTGRAAAGPDFRSTPPPRACRPAIARQMASASS